MSQIILLFTKVLRNVCWMDGGVVRLIFTYFVRRNKQKLYKVKGHK